MIYLSDRVKIETKTDYYKYNSWTQPILSSNTSSSNMWLEDPKLSGTTVNSEETDIETWGTLEAHNFIYAYCMFNNNSSYDNSFGTKNNDYNVIDICFSNYMKLSNIEIDCYDIATYSIHSSYISNIICYKVDKDELINLGYATFNTYTGNLNLNSNTKIKKLRVCFKRSSSNMAFIKKLTITGTKAEESTSSSYDFTEDKQISKTIYNVINPTYSGIILEGNITRHNNNISGFTTNALTDYAKFKEPFNPVGNNFEICIGFTTGDNVATGSNQGLFNTNGATSAEYRGIVLHLAANGRLVVGSTNSDNSAWLGSIYGPVAAINTKYWLKAVRDNGYLKGYYSTDNKVWTFMNSVVLDFNYTTFTQTYLGSRYSPANTANKIYEPFEGEIDLNSSYIKINNSYWWTGTIANTKTYYI